SATVSARSNLLLAKGLRAARPVALFVLAIQRQCDTVLPFFIDPLVGPAENARFSYISGSGPAKLLSLASSGNPV
ncbi:MAG: hypothetical protein LBI76_14935, partial [Comamonas sp.]|nr:hypothetical protein [Comamonas sp.]